MQMGFVHYVPAADRVWSMSVLDPILPQRSILEQEYGFLETGDRFRVAGLIDHDYGWDRVCGECQRILPPAMEASFPRERSIVPTALEGRIDPVPVEVPDHFAEFT